MKIKRKIAKILCIIMVLTGVIIPSFSLKAQTAYSLTGVAHIQTFGNVNGTWDGTSLKMGTKGQSKRLESITINFKNNTGYSGDLIYRVHRQTYGWTDWINSGKPAGTTGEGKRLEGIQMKLTGELAKHYSVRYRVHIQTYGDNQDWQYDGALAGTEGESKRLENLEVQLVPKNIGNTVIYRVHRQTYGWEDEYRANGNMSGTTGQSKRLEGIEIALTGNQYSGSVNYCTQVQTYGWQDPVSDGLMSGTSGKSKRLETIKIWLTGDIANYYDIYYRVHSQTFGWMSWAKNGEPAGTEGLSKRLEAIQITLVRKGYAIPSSNFKGATATSLYSYYNRSGGTVGYNGNTAGNNGNGGNNGNDNNVPPNTEVPRVNTFTQMQTEAYWTTRTKEFNYCRSCRGMFNTDEDGAEWVNHGKKCSDAEWIDYYLSFNGNKTHFYQCSVCKVVYVSEEDFDNHKGYIHGYNDTESYPQDIDDQYYPSQTYWECDTCKECFYSISSRDAHKSMKCSKNETSYVCSKCGKSFTTLYDYYNHAE